MSEYMVFLHDTCRNNGNIEDRMNTNVHCADTRWPPVLVSSSLLAMSAVAVITPLGGDDVFECVSGHLVELGTVTSVLC